MKDAHAILARTRNPFIPHETCQGYIATDAEVFAYEGLTDRFVGTVGSFASPVLLQQGRDLGNGLGTVRGICGMLQTKLTLAPGEEKTVHYLLGLCTGEEDLKNNTKDVLKKLTACLKRQWIVVQNASAHCAPCPPTNASTT